MTLRPEQARALAYARRRGSDAPLAEVRSRVAATCEALDALLDTIAADAARRRTRASGWSIHEVADHLLVSDTPAVAQLRDLLAGRDVAEPIPASLQSPDPFAADWPALRDALRAVHRELVALLDGAGDSTAAAATAPVQMVVQCAEPDGTLRPVQWIERFDWKAFAILLHAHNREHIAQVERIRAALADDGGEGPDGARGPAAAP